MIKMIFKDTAPNQTKTDFIVEFKLHICQNQIKSGKFNIPNTSVVFFKLKGQNIKDANSTQTTD